MKTVIEMAREAGFTEGELAFMGDNFLRFADLVRAETLAEHPAPSQYGSPELQAMIVARAIDKDKSEQPAQQQEPVAWSCKSRILEFWTTDEYEAKIKAKEGYTVTALYTSPPASKPWVGLVHEETHEAIGTAGVDLLELAKLWSDNKVHVYQFDNEARKIIEAVLCRASAKLREKNT